VIGIGLCCCDSELLLGATVPVQVVIIVIGLQVVIVTFALAHALLLWLDSSCHHFETLVQVLTFVVCRRNLRI